MRPLPSSVAVAVLLALLPAPGAAHFNILLPDAHSVKKGDPVTLFYHWGHPFEHQLFDAPMPAKVFVIAPDGKQTDLRKQLEQVKHATPDKKTVTAFRLKYTPDQRGDYTFVLQTPPIFLEEDAEFVQDVVKVVVHVQGQKNWDADGDPEAIKVRPLTRPYGLQPGMVFQARFTALGMKEHRPLDGTLVEVERYNAAPPAKLPPDEHITRTVKTDPNGVVTATLPEPGWWSLTGEVDGGFQEHKGKKYPLRQRATLWVHVDAKVGN